MISLDVMPRMYAPTYTPISALRWPPTTSHLFNHPPKKPSQQFITHHPPHPPPLQLNLHLPRPHPQIHRQQNNLVPPKPTLRPPNSIQPPQPQPKIQPPALNHRRRSPIMHHKLSSRNPIPPFHPAIKQIDTRPHKQIRTLNFGRRVHNRRRPLESGEVVRCRQSGDFLVGHCCCFCVSQPVDV